MHCRAQLPQVWQATHFPPPLGKSFGPPEHSPHPTERVISRVYQHTTQKELKDFTPFGSSYQSATAAALYAVQHSARDGSKPLVVELITTSSEDGSISTLLPHVWQVSDQFQLKLVKERNWKGNGVDVINYQLPTPPPLVHRIITTCEALRNVWDTTKVG
jgi:hypothetical protein